MSHPLRILFGGRLPSASTLAVLERDPALALEQAQDPSQFAARLSVGELDAALLALEGAIEVHRIAAYAPAAPLRRVPLLLLVDERHAGSAGALLAAWAAGPADVAVRTSSPAEIGWRLGRLAELAREIDALEERAAHDERTGLLRAHEFERRVREHASAAERHGHALALVLLDLDRFGDVNKRHDHPSGDRVIASVGAAIRAGLRLEDVAGRLGGDEFGMLLPYTTRIDAARVVARLLSRVRALRVASTRTGEPIEVRGSIGFETFDGGDAGGADLLRAHAEAALRAAKEGGGDRAIYFRSLGV